MRDTSACSALEVDNFMRYINLLTYLLTGSRLLHVRRASLQRRRSPGNGRIRQVSHTVCELDTSADERDATQGLRQCEGCLLVQGIHSQTLHQCRSPPPPPPHLCVPCNNRAEARQLYKNISMLFLFTVKDGKLSTGVNATFDASCYG